MPLPDGYDEITTAAGCWLSLALLASSFPSPSPRQCVDEGISVILQPPPNPPPALPSVTFSQPYLDIQAAPVLPPGASLLDHPELVWAEDTSTERDEAAAALLCATQQGAILAPHRVRRFEVLASKNWDMFYKHNRDKFFKDRHYLWKDFPDLVPQGMEEGRGGRGGGRAIDEEYEEEKLEDGEREDEGALQSRPSPSEHPSSSSSSSSLLSSSLSFPPPHNPALQEQDVNQSKGNDSESQINTPAPHHRILIELGCGVGNAVFPLLERDPDLFVYALDFSPRAIALVKAHPLYKQTKRCQAIVHDAVLDPSLPPALTLNGGQADLCLCMYALSAMAPGKIKSVAVKIRAALKPGGRVLIRDYGRWDEAQLRFKRGHRLAENFYLRSDGTRAYYFSVEDLRKMFGVGEGGEEGEEEGGGFEEVEVGYVRRQYINRGDAVTRRRVWVHARFEKPVEKGKGKGKGADVIEMNV